MIKDVGIALLMLCIGRFPGAAQVTLSGQTAAEVYKSTASLSPRSENEGRPSFGWEVDLFVDGFVTDHVSAMGTVRVAEDQTISVDYAAIRLADLTPLHLNVQAGKFDLPFGNLGERRFPRRNFLFGLPLLYEYATSLPDHLTSDEEVLAGRGKSGGMRVLDGGMYDPGAMLFGSFGIIDYAVAVSNGTISETSYGGGNANSELGTVVRVAIAPFTGLTVGAGYARGAFLEEPEGQSAAAVNVNAYHQQALEADVEFSYGHAVMYGEAVYNSWPVPLASGKKDFNVFGYYAEGKYTVIPRVYVALRMSGLRFGNVQLAGQEQPWDYNVTEWEGGVGYFLDRDVLLKLVRRETRTYGGSRPKDNLTALQLTVAY